MSAQTSDAAHGAETADGDSIPGTEQLERRSTGFTTRKSIALGVCFALFGFLAGLLAGIDTGRDPFGSINPSQSMAQCRLETLGLLGTKENPTASTLREAIEHCYSLLQSETVLNDFIIRKGIFGQQYRSHAALIWLVISMTISGVALSAVQLVSSLEMARSNKHSSRERSADINEIALARDKLVLKSSVTGLCILAISFSFFLVFVLYVYPQQEISNRSSPLIKTELPIGGLGPPPAAPKNPDAH